jgi:hypothetical protein
MHIPVTVYSNVRIDKETHSIDKDSVCKRKCAIECFYNKMRFHQHMFNLTEEKPEILFFEGSTGKTRHTCPLNTCLCECKK